MKKSPLREAVPQLKKFVAGAATTVEAVVAAEAVTLVETTDGVAVIETAAIEIVGAIETEMAKRSAEPEARAVGLQDRAIAINNTRKKMQWKT